MEISATCVSKAGASTLCSPFSDQSHLQFYARRANCFKLPCRPSLSLASKPVPVPFRAQALCELAGKAPTELTAEQALMKELADLKIQMKQRKKELKAYMKEEKRKLKLQLKVEKKRKQKDAEEGKMKMKCQSDSTSSSSESSDGECSSVSMTILRQGQYMVEEARLNDGGCSVLEGCVAGSAVASPSVVSKDVSMDVSEGVVLPLSSDVMEGCNGKYVRVKPSATEEVLETCPIASSIASSNCSSLIAKVNSEPENVRMLSPCNSRGAGRYGPISHGLPTVHTSNRIEVCAGGKCKKAGSAQLLSALQGQIPGSSNVEAVPCKCMGKCGMAINVRVLKEDTNPQHHSYVGVEDGALILGYHFGLARPPLELPSFSSPKYELRVPVPSPLLTV